MIRSRAGNIAIVTTGLAFLALFVTATRDVVRESGWSGVGEPTFLLFFAVPLGGAGLWLVMGASRNLRRLKRTDASELPPPVGPFVRVLFAVAVLGVILEVLAVLLSIHTNSRAPELLAGAGIWSVLATLAALLINGLIPRRPRSSSVTPE